MEKAKAGEGRNVEHVALEDDATLALSSAQQPKRRKRKQAPEAEQVLQCTYLSFEDCCHLLWFNAGFVVKA